MTTTTISDRQFEIIVAAGKILSASGVGRLTIKNLAREMGFSESAIYRHFDSKEDILVAMLNFLAEDMDERLNQVVSTLKSPTENLDAIFLDQFAFFFQKPAFRGRCFFGRAHGGQSENQCGYPPHHAGKNETPHAGHHAGTTAGIFYQHHNDRGNDAHHHGQFSLANVQMAHRQFSI